VIKGAFNQLTSYEDLEKAKQFFKDKGELYHCSEEASLRGVDVSRFRLVVSQAYDSIQASADWLSRDKNDVEEVG
jgi:aminopeptidase 2